MSMLEEQIRMRRKLDDERYENASNALKASITGDARGHLPVDAKAEASLETILRQLGVRTKPPEARKDEPMTLYLERALDVTGIMVREVTLTPGWHKDALGVMLAFDAQEDAVAVIPGTKGYSIKDATSGTSKPVNRSSSRELEGAAFCFYRPLPNSKLSVRQLIEYLFHTLDRSDYVRIILAMVVATCLGMLIPVITQFAFGFVVDYGQASLLIPLAIALFSITLAQLIIEAMKSLVMTRIGTKLSFNIEAAAMMRMLSLPVSYFTTRSVGEVRTQISLMGTITSQIQQILFGSTLTSLFSIVYIVQMASYAPSLVLPALLIFLFTLIVNVACALLGKDVAARLLDASTDTSAKELALLSALQKIKLAGVEKRAMAIWMESYARKSTYLYGRPGPSVVIGPAVTAINLVGLVAIYIAGYVSGVSAAEYMAFNSAFGLVSGALSALSSAIMSIIAIRPNLESVEPLMTTLPEVNESRKRVDSLAGAIRMENVGFAYPGQDPLFSGLSLQIKPGEYVGIVGKTGCGKSTLMRLLLGFESPSHGTITYDGRSMASLDVVSLRRSIGTVLQNGKLFSGDIYSNISINAPTMTREECMEVCDMVGLGDDVRAMPMGLFTMVDGGLSGGQRQRILIARAIAPRPKVLFFDEATSALDNVTQRQVTQSLESLNCTRIAIAHRLTTIRGCDRILVLDQGVIAEEGTFDELVARKGLFYDLVNRQME